MDFKYKRFYAGADTPYSNYYFFNGDGLSFRRFNQNNNGRASYKDTRVGSFVITDCRFYSNRNISVFKDNVSIRYDMDVYIPSRMDTYEFRNKSFAGLVHSLQELMVVKDDKFLRDILKAFLMYNLDVKRSIVAEEGVSFGGFFLNDDGVVVHDQDLDYTVEELGEAISVFNEICSSRDELGKGLGYDMVVYRFMLWSPFSFVFKQLGLEDLLYGLILQGASDTNKTGSIRIGRLFYDYVNDMNVSTVSALGSVVAEDTFPSVVNEAKYLLGLDEVIELSKNCTDSFSARAVKNRYDNTKVDNFLALSVPVYTYNGIQNYPFEIHKRYKVLTYDDDMRIPRNKARDEFNLKYRLSYVDSPARVLHMIGHAFASKLIKLIEAGDELIKVLMECGNDLEGLVMHILHIIGEEAGVCFHEGIFERDVIDKLKVKEFIQAFMQQWLGGAIKFLGRGGNSDYNAILTVIRRGNFPWLCLCKDGDIALRFDKLYNDLHLNKELRDVNITKDVLWDAIGIERDRLEGVDKAVKITKENGQNTSWKNVVFLSMDEVVNKVFQFNMRIED
jgi:hypothetical protein